MSDEILLVDEKDQIIGYGEKMEVHRKHQLHRAFSVFIVDPEKKKLLLQKRAFGKYHSGGLWTNACCSHPRKDETMEETIHNRLIEELGLYTQLGIKVLKSNEEAKVSDQLIYECGVFQYYAPFEDLAEKEIDHVFLFHPTQLPTEWKMNPEEIAESKWIGIAELDAWLSKSPEEFTAWFAKAYALVRPFLLEDCGSTKYRTIQ